MTTPTNKSECGFDVESLRTAVNLLSTEKATLQSQLTDLSAQVEALHADGAVMRGVLKSISEEVCLLSHPYDCDCCLKESEAQSIATETLESTDAGRDLLARVQELEVTLERCQSERNAAVADVCAERDRLISTLHQRDTALVVAREALVSMRRCGVVKPDRIDHALSQIQSCEVKR